MYIIGIHIPLWIPLLLSAILIAILAIVGIRIYKYRHQAQIDKDAIDELIDKAGYVYDSTEDIFYSKMDAWQRKMGYCRLYDEAAAPLSMIIDSEPIYFDYGGKRWMIEFRKGQYGMTTGGEIGVYNTDRPDLNIPGVFSGSFYDCVDDEDMLPMSLSLYKNNELILSRYARHWWLTGFKLGEFSNPSELSMILNITLKDSVMRNAFIRGLLNAGYSEREIWIYGNGVGLIYRKPYSTQSWTRMETTDRIVQEKNRLLCEKYQEITRPYDNFYDQLVVIQEKAPELYSMISIGKTRQLYSAFNKIKEWI
jgi:hypothetical protein